jgi:hypothetical protein
MVIISGSPISISIDQTGLSAHSDGDCDGSLEGDKDKLGKVEGEVDTLGDSDKTLGALLKRIDPPQTQHACEAVSPLTTCAP